MAESTVQIASGSAAVGVDIAQIVAYTLNALVSRQIMVVGDPNNALGQSAVAQGGLTGAEFGLAVKLAPNSPDLVALNATMQGVLIELQNLVTLLGSN